MYILGISAFSHDAAAALIKDGKICAFVEQERLNRQKYTTEFPYEAIVECLRIAGIGIRDIEGFAFFNNPNLELFAGIYHGLRYFPGSLHLFSSTFGANAGKRGHSFGSRVRAFYSVGKIVQERFKLAERPTIFNCEHHLAHAASAFYPSGFADAAIVTWDGRGEIASTAGWVGSGNKIQKVFQVNIPHSIGIFYSTITKFLGFVPFADEWKVMGMSAYGTDALVQEFQQLFSLQEKGQYRLNLEYFSYHKYGKNKLWSDRFEKSFGPARSPGEAITQKHFDLAFAAQRACETMGLHVVDWMRKRTGKQNLCMTGGVAQNILLNSRIVADGGFKAYFVQPIATDAGAAYGAALAAYYSRGFPAEDREILRGIAWGPEYSDLEIADALLKNGLEPRRVSNIAQSVAESLQRGKIVAWFQGRMEAGPRALGSRSLLANPTKLEFKERLNRLIKKRESFRPFAPSVLAEEANHYFEDLCLPLCDYMVASAKVKSEMKDKIPAVVHVDGSARPQTVHKAESPLYWDLIHRFSKLSGVPIVLNTSFNEQEPIVCTPDDAIKTFLRAEIDELAIGSFHLENPNIQKV